MEHVVIRKLEEDEAKSMNLLFLADPSEKMIEGYINSGKNYVAEIDSKIVGIDRDYFIRKYPNEIVENGIPCRDMIRLSFEIKE